jgi:tyrosinase
MAAISRRSFIKGVAAIPFATWAARNAKAFGPLVRYDARSAGGIAMLGILADAVKAMKARPESDPRSWLWQWYTHFVSGATTKSAEINRIFGTTTTSRSALANETWNTCQSHSGQNSNYFLPWHRMFVYFFEQIVRQVSRRPDFALPYWDYTSSDPAKRGVVPAHFRMSRDARFQYLYRPDRTSLANTGQPIHKYQAGDPMDITKAMAAPNYSTYGDVQGFCRAIDSGIHGRIHVLTGTSKNMGSLSYAGQDPLFWVHHSNIDRMWASWNQNGGVNPSTQTWASRSFVFIDGLGQRVTGVIRDFFDMAALDYTYDAFIPAPASSTSSTSAALRVAGGAPQRVAAATTEANLGATPVKVRLLPVAGTAAAAAVVGLDNTLAGRRSYLVLRNLHTWKQPEVLYHVYLTPVTGGGLNNTSYAGNINFFDAEFHDHGGGSPLDEALGENFYSFDVTDILERLARSGRADVREALAVTFVPGGRPAAGANPMVATIDLVVQ